MISAQDLLSLAEKIIKNGQTEIDCRNSVSRAYYAVYHFVKPLAEKCPHDPSDPRNAKAGSHKKMYFKLDRCPNSYPDFLMLRSIGMMGLDLLEIREVADYHLQEDLGIAEANRVIERARILRDKVNHYLKANP